MSEYQPGDRWGHQALIVGGQVVVFALGPGTAMSDVQQLVAALEQLCKEHAAGSSPVARSKAEAGDPGPPPSWLFSGLPNVRLSPREAFFSSSRRQVPIMSTVYNRSPVTLREQQLIRHFATLE